MNNLMDKILALAEKEHAAKVTVVSVKLGALSNMSAGHFKEHFEIAAKGTIAEGAEIDAEESPNLHEPDAQAILLKSIDVVKYTQTGVLQFPRGSV